MSVLLIIMTTIKINKQFQRQKIFTLISWTLYSKNNYLPQEEVGLFFKKKKCEKKTNYFFSPLNFFFAPFFTQTDLLFLDHWFHRENVLTRLAKNQQDQWSFFLFFTKMLLTVSNSCCAHCARNKMLTKSKLLLNVTKTLLKVSQ